MWPLKLKKSAKKLDIFEAICKKVRDSNFLAHVFFLFSKATPQVEGIASLLKDGGGFLLFFCKIHIVDLAVRSNQS